MSWRGAIMGLLGMAACAAEPGAVPPLVLISLDGFRWDYLDQFPNEAPTLRRLRAEGATARGLIPVFPSNTFPNHYTIVTGLYPAKHGIVNNDFFDPKSGSIFRYIQAASVRDARWWGGEPIWVTAINQGRKAATAFWVGSEAPVGGVRPTFWRHYDYSLPFEKRLEEFAGWLRLPAAERPAVVAMYFEETNAAGHRHGPASPQVVAAIKILDGNIAAMLARLRDDGLKANIIIVSDHGMTATSADRVVILDDLVDLKTVQVDADGSALALRPLQDNGAELLRVFANVPHVKAYRAEDLPAHFRFHGNPRIAPIWVLPEEGWHVVTRATFNRLKTRYAPAEYLPGDHGYDPRLKNMWGIFIAHGPAFRSGVELPEFENVHLYNLMCAVAGLKPARNDGDNRLLAILRTAAVKN